MSELKDVAPIIIIGPPDYTENEPLTNPDFKIVVKDVTIPIHKAVLRKASEYFRGLFDSGMQEVLGSQVDVSYARVDVVKNVIKFVYGSDISIPWDDVKEYIEMAEFWLLEPLKHRLESYIMANINVRNCIEWYCYSERYQLEKVKRRSQFVLQSNFVEVTSNDAFMSLNLEELKGLLSPDVLQHWSTNNKLKCCMAWIQADEHYQKQYFFDLLDHIEVTKCPEEYIRLALRVHINSADSDQPTSSNSARQSSPYFAQTEQHAFSDSALPQQISSNFATSEQHTSPNSAETEQLLQSSIGPGNSAQRCSDFAQTNPQTCDSQPWDLLKHLEKSSKDHKSFESDFQTLVHAINSRTKHNRQRQGSQVWAVGGWKKHTSLNENVICIDMGSRKTTTEWTLPVVFQKHSPARCDTPAGLFSCGGGIRQLFSFTSDCALTETDVGSNVCGILNISARQFVLLPPPPVPLYRAGAVSIGENVYVLGGIGTEHQVYCFNLRTLEWKTCAELKQGTYNPLVSSVGDSIFVFQQAEDQEFIALQRYDTKSNQWSFRYTSLGFPIDTRGASCASMSNSSRFLYLVGGADRLCVRYDIAKNEIVALASPMSCHMEGSCVMLALLGQRYIILCGGQDSGEVSIEVYNIKRNKWTVSTLHLHLWGHYCTVVE